MEKLNNYQTIDSMEKRTKIIFIVSGVLLVTVALGTLIYWVVNKDETEDQQDKDINPDAAKQPKVETTQNENWSGGSSEGGGAGTTWDDVPDLIEPIYDVEKQLSNPMRQLKGHTLYPKSLSEEGAGYANIRSSAEVNNNTSWWTDGISNLITSINSGVPIGKVTTEVSGLYNGFSYRWFKVKLTEPTGGWFSNYTEGFVRADTVTFKPYE